MAEEGKFRDRAENPYIGKSGRKGRLDEQTMGYYRRVSDTLNEKFDSPEDKELMLDNVFKQLCEEALRVSCNQTVSTIVESLLHEATKGQLVMFMNSFSCDWETACQDRFAGYVTQTLLYKMVPLIAQSRDEDEDFVDLKSPQDLVVELYEFLMSNLALFMQDTYASHVLRVVMEVLAGSEVNEEVIRSKVARRRDQQQSTKSGHNPKSYKTPQEFNVCLNTMAQKVFSMKKLKDHVTNHMSNPVMQTLLLLLQKTSPDLCAEMCQLLINNTEMFAPGINNTLPTLLTDTVGSHLVEQLVAVAPNALYAAILDHHLHGRLMEMAADPVANFVLQHVIQHAHSEAQFEVIFAELSNHLEDILAHNNFGIITRLADGCLKHGTKQKKFIKKMLKAFHCYEPAERQLVAVPLVMMLKAYDCCYEGEPLEVEKAPDSGKEEEENKNVVKTTPIKDVNYHGAMFLQKLLQFGNPHIIATSLLEMSSSDLVTVARDKFGSHVLDAFLKSTTVGEKNRRRLYTKLKGCYMDIACSRLGSHVVDTLWAHANLKQKYMVAEELSKQEEKLRSNQFGFFVWRNLAIGHFIRRPADWKDLQQGSIKKRKLFQDIIGDKTEKGTSYQKSERIKDEKGSIIPPKELEAPVLDKSATTAIDDIFAASKKKRNKKNVEEADGNEEMTSSKAKKRKRSDPVPSTEVCNVPQKETVIGGKKKKKKGDRKKSTSCHQEMIQTLSEDSGKSLELQHKVKRKTRRDKV